VGDNHIILRGTGFTYDGNGALLTGTVTQIEFDNGDNVPLAIVETSYDAAKLYQIMSAQGVDDLVIALSDGKDTIHGSLLRDSLNGGKAADTIAAGYGDDFIDGGKGNDHLAGGHGSDTFFFRTGDGKDVVTDFDAKGADHDFIGLESADEHYTIKKSGHDTIIDFSDGDMITLLGAKAHSVTDHDFSMVQ
jgi:Ca2+-binding RTX toxin-like protein